MTTSLYPVPSKEEVRLQAVLSLFRGEKASGVASKFNIARSDLYKFGRRAINAMRDALADQPRGPKRPYNRISCEQERKLVAICKLHPTLSSYQVHNRLDGKPPSPRTIQRVRKRNCLTRLSKRSPAWSSARRLPQGTIERAEQLIRQKPHLGPERISWDLQNGEAIQISPSSVKRIKRKLRDAMRPPKSRPVWRFYERHHPHSLWHGDFMEKVTLTDTHETAYHLSLLDDYSRGYVFCDLFLGTDQRDVIRALIVAMREYQVIPKAVIFDNGSSFKGNLISAFCEHLGVELIHTSVRHPQTNGKLERAFRDDMKDFYLQYDQWLLEPLRRELPKYIHYRNYIRGHGALGGKPAITRLREQTRFAPAEVLGRLESYACYEVRRKIIPQSGSVRMLGRDAHIGTELAGVEVTFVETLEGLEARVEDQWIGVLRGYRDMLRIYPWQRAEQLPPVLCFERGPRADCPRIAVA